MGITCYRGRHRLLYHKFCEDKPLHMISSYRVGHEKVARLLFAFAFGYCIHFRIYAMLRTRAPFSWPTLYNST